MMMKNLHLRNTDPNFLGFVQELIDLGILDNKQKGIAARMLDKGYESLSEKQKYVFDKMIEEHSLQECSHCGQTIPWEEITAAQANGGMCSWCQHQWEKIKKE
jgi:RNA polymerase-binding transcription factor DksA